MSFFSLDSKFMQAMSRISDLIILNFLFLLTSLPIFTIGAASTAMYAVAFRMGTEEEIGAFKGYLRAFRDNLWQGCALFLLLVIPAVLLIVPFFFYSSLEGLARLPAYLCVPPFLLLILVYSYAFPLLSQFSNTVRNTLRNALLLSVGYLPRSILIALINLLPLILYLFATFFFYRIGIVWILLYFSGAAYLNAQLLRKVFAPYQEKEEASD